MLLLVLPLVLAGCGFHPLYAERDESRYDSELAAVKVGLIPNRLGQELSISLRDAFNPTGASVPTHYLLEVSLATQRNDLGISAGATALRSEMIVVANYKITDVKTHQQVLSGSTRAVSAFDVLSDGYATTVAQQSATQRALDELADDLRERVTLFIHSRRATASNS